MLSRCHWSRMDSVTFNGGRNGQASKSTAERQAAFRARKREAGLVSVTVMIPAHLEAQLRAAAARLMREAGLELGPLRESKSGKLRKLEC
jgi:hypothetical protein